jgi:hypothetical protein
MDRQELVGLLRAFEQSGLEYVLIGATAMGFHGVIRATQDVDVIVRATPENLERLRQAFRAAYPGDSHVDEILDADLLGDYPTVRYCPPQGSLYVDVLTRLGEVADFESVESEIKTLDGIRVSVATPRALYLLKKDTLRPLDHQDAAMLARQFDLKDGA